MKKIVIFRMNSGFNMVTPKQWKKNAQKLGEAVTATARIRSISEATFRQFAHLTHRKEVQNYLKEVWLS